MDINFKKLSHLAYIAVAILAIFHMNGVVLAESVTSTLEKTSDARQWRLAPKPTWQRNASASIRAYAGSTLQYLEEGQQGRYRGVDLGLSYKLPENTTLAASLGLESNPDQYRDDDLNHKDSEYQVSDINFSYAMPQVAKYEDLGISIGSSVSGFYPLSRGSRVDDLYTTLSNAWDIRWGHDAYSFGARASYSKNLYKYTEQMQEVRRGDQLGSSHIDQFMNAGLTADYHFAFGLNMSAVYGVSRFYPYQGEFFHVNSSRLSMSYAVKAWTPYFSIRTAASQLNHDNRINYAVLEKNRSRGEIGVSYGF